MFTPPTNIILSPQERISRALSRMQRKLFDVAIRTTGVGSTNTFTIQYIEDKYKNSNTGMLNYKQIYCNIDFPGKELPMSSSDFTNASPVSIHLYDILPIQGYFRFEDNMHLKDIVLYKVKLGDGTYHAFELQLINPIIKATSTDVVWQVWDMALVTDFALRNDSEYVRIKELFLTNDTW